MVFHWISSKLKRNQLVKAITTEEDKGVIIAGMTVLNPTYRMFFDDGYFYDKETDTVDFRKLEEHLRNNGSLYAKYDYHYSQCDSCFYYEWSKKDIRHAASNLNDSIMDYDDRRELENLKELFCILTGEDEYHSVTDMEKIKEIIQDYHDQYRNLDETISNFENRILEKNKEIERLNYILDSKNPQDKTKHSHEIVAVDNREIKRGDKRYNSFKLNVLKRDKVCQCCGSSEDLHVHHLASFKLHNSRGADLDNGIVLCKECHNQYHSLYGKSERNNPVNFSKFLREYGKPQQCHLDYDTNNFDDFSVEILEGK